MSTRTPAELIATLDGLIALGDAATLGECRPDSDGDCMSVAVTHNRISRNLLDLKGDNQEANAIFFAAAGTHFKDVLKSLKVAVVALEVIRDYYSGAGYIGAKADDALNSILESA